MDFYDKVTSQRIEVPQFNQTDSSVQLARLGSGSRPNRFAIEVGQHQGNFRFLVAEEWPTTKTLEMIGKDADIAWDCFLEVWPASRLGRKPVLVEVNLRTTAAAEGGDATRYLADECFRISHSALATLERRPQGLGFRIMIPVEVSGQEIPLNGAGATIRVETLMDDPSRIYFEAKFQWPSVPVPAEVREKTGAPEQINPEVRRPSEYLTEADAFIKQQLAEFLLTSAKE